MDPLSEIPIHGVGFATTMPQPFPSPPHSHSHPTSSNTSSTTPSKSGGNGVSTVVQTRMKKSHANFTVHFVGLSGYPNQLNEATSSPLVEVDELIWSVTIFPGGMNGDSTFLACGIVLESPKKIRASYRISLVNQMGWKNHTVVSDNVKTFDGQATGSPHVSSRAHFESKFISRDALKNAASGHCVDDTIIVQVELVIFGDMETAVVSAPAKPIDHLRVGNTLQQDLRALLHSPELADVQLIVEDTVIPAHKFILALRSSVFRAMLNGPMSEGVSGKVVITDFSAEAIQDMLCFMYTDTISESALVQHCDELLAIACKYDIGMLQSLCETQLVATMTVNNASNLLQMADLYGAVHLKHRCLHFVAQNARAVASHDSFYDNLSASLCHEVIRAIAGAI